MLMLQYRGNQCQLFVNKARSINKEQIVFKTRKLKTALSSLGRHSLTIWNPMWSTNCLNINNNNVNSRLKYKSVGTKSPEQIKQKHHNNMK